MSSDRTGQRRSTIEGGQCIQSQMIRWNTDRGCHELVVTSVTTKLQHVLNNHFQISARRRGGDPQAIIFLQRSVTRSSFLHLIPCPSGTVTKVLGSWVTSAWKKIQGNVCENNIQSINRINEKIFYSPIKCIWLCISYFQRILQMFRSVAMSIFWASFHLEDQ